MCFFVGNLFLREAWGQSKQDPNKGRKSKLSCWAPEILITNNHSCLLGRSLPKNHLQQDYLPLLLCCAGDNENISFVSNNSVHQGKKKKQSVQVAWIAIQFAQLQQQRTQLWGIVWWNRLLNSILWQGMTKQNIFDPEFLKHLINKEKNCHCALI